MRGTLLALLLAAGPAFAAPYDVAEKDIATLQADLRRGVSLRCSWSRPI